MSQKTWSMIRGCRAKRRSFDDAVADAEIDRCRQERARKNGNQPPPPAPPRYCHCIELVVNGRRVPIPQGHDCGYVAARSALVWQASRIATEKIGDPATNAVLGCRWTKEFNRQMDRLAALLLNGSNGNGSGPERQGVQNVEMNSDSLNGQNGVTDASLLH